MKKLLKKKIKKIFWWSIFIYFIAPSVVFGITDLILGIGDNFGSKVIGGSNDENCFKPYEFEPSSWTKISPVEGWDIPPEWLEVWLEAQKNK